MTTPVAQRSPDQWQAIHGAWTILVWLSAAITLIAFSMPWISLGPRPSHPSKPVRQESKAPPRPSANLQLSPEFSRVLKNVSRDIARTADTMVKLRIRITGAQIPRMANQEQTKAALDLMERMTKKRQNLGLKSYAVYLVPGLALLCAGTLIRRGRRKWVAAAVAVICAGIALGGGIELLIVGAQQTLNGVRLESGLWLSLLGYAGLAVAAFVQLFPGRIQAWMERRAAMTSPSTA